LQVFNVFANIQPPAARFWWLLQQPHRCDTERKVFKRACGSALAFRAPKFTGSSSRSGSSSDGCKASNSKGSRKTAGRQLRARAAAAAGGADADSDSSSDGAAAGAVAARELRTALIVQHVVYDSGVERIGHDPMGLTVFDSSEDEAEAVGAAYAAARCIQQRELYLEVRRQRLHQEQQQQQQQQASQGSLWPPEQHQEQVQAYVRTKEEMVKVTQQLRLPPLGWAWQQGCSLLEDPLPGDTTATVSHSSSSNSGSGDGSSSSGSTKDAGVVLQSRACMDGGVPASWLLGSSFRSPRQQLERQLQRRLRKAQLLAHKYDWGGVRPWHVQRVRVLMQQQLQLNRMLQLQDRATQRCKVASDAPKLWLQPQQQQQQQQHCSVLHRLTTSHNQVLAAVHSALAAAKGMGGSLEAAMSAHLSADAANGLPQGLICITLQQQQQQHAFLPGLALQPRGSTGLPAQELVISSNEPANSIRPVSSIVIRQIRTTQEQSAMLQAGPASTACGGSGRERDGLQQGVAVCAALDQMQQQGKDSVTARHLLWQAVCQLKPAAEAWYQRAAAHQQQQQQQQQQQGQPAEVTMPESTSPALWSTLTRSLASDLLLVPPGIRDMIGNDWAAGAGRLAGAGVSSSSSSSAAARMLAVQYARAARRQYAQVGTVKRTCCSLRQSTLF
jgi:hypothetical protein